MGKPLRPLLLCLAVGLFVAAPADAAITASNISSPANGSELFFNGDNGTGAITVSGTVTGATPGARGDIVCYTKSDSSATTIVSGVDVSSGSFAINVSLKPVAGSACRLAIIPAFSGITGDGASVFTGPAISVSDEFSHSNTGSLYGYAILSGTLPWAFTFQSLGDCPLATSWSTDSSTLGAFSLFTGNACLLKTSGVGVAAGTRAGLQVDGLNAYAPAAISTLATQAGFAPLSYVALFNAAHDAVIISETDNLMICDPPATFPPTTTTCPSLHPAGIQVQQATVLRNNGQVARITQRFSSVDGRSHNLDALFSQSVSAPASGDSPAFEFPGQGSFATHSAPDSFAAFPSGPGSIAAISDGSGFLPAVSNPIGTITYSRPPTSVDFVSGKGTQRATFLMHYADTVAAGGVVTYDWSFIQSASSDDLQNLEVVERDHFGSPTLVFVNPRNGATVRSSTVRVQGRVEDSVQVAGLTVAGQNVIVRPGGIFGVTVPLKPGRNTITAIARNKAGNSATGTITVRYTPRPCTVPRLRGMTLARALRALVRDGCALGHVTHHRSRSVRQGRVIASRPRAGRTRPHGTKVALVLSAGR